MKRLYKFLSFVLILPLFVSTLTVSGTTLPNFQLSARGYCGFNYLQWEKVDNAHRYYIYRGIGSGNQSKMPLTDFPISDTHYKDSKNIANGTTYCYFVVAFDADNNRIATSNEACATPSCPQDESECLTNLKYQVNNRKYWVNDVEKGPMETSPVIQWDRMFLLISYVAKEVGASIGWDGTTRTVKIVTISGTTIEFQIGNNKYKLNGVEQFIDPHNPSVVPFIKEGRSLMPLRVTAEALETEKIEWYGDTRIAELIFKNKGRCDCICPCPEYAPYANDYCMVSGCHLEYHKNSTSLTHAEEMWVPVKAIPCTDADSKDPGWRSACKLPAGPTPHAGTSDDPYSPWETIYRNGGCWVYPDMPVWNAAPNQDISTIYRHKFKNPRCTHLRLDLFVDDEVDVYLDGMTDEHFIGTAKGFCNASSMKAYNVQPGEHVLYFIHKNITAPLYGLIYGIKCIPCEDPSPNEMGRIIAKVYCDNPTAMIPVPNVGIKVLKASDSTIVWSGHTNSTGLADTSYSLAPGNYKVVPFINGTKCKSISPLSHNITVVAGTEKEARFVCKCGEENEQGGRIIVHVPEECIKGTKVWIFNEETGDEVWHGYANDNGVFDTDCKLKCPATYKIVPKNPNCVFFPEEQIVDVPCCPEVVKVEFQCECDHPDEGGRILVKMPEECLDNTVVYIYADDGTIAWKGVVNEDGVFDTGCTLKCPAVYKVVPKNKYCEFFPEAKSVEVPCCPEIAIVRFECECDHPSEEYCGCIVRMTTQEDSDGFYSIYFKKDCSDDPPVYDMVIRFPGSLLDTNLGLSVLDYFNSVPGEVPDKYACIDVKVNAMGEAIEWSAHPDRKPCCGEDEGGRIVVYMPRECIDGTVVYIYSEAGDVVWKDKANDEGVFDTDCTLKCPAMYKVVPRNPNCVFYPESIEVKVPCCPEIAKVAFQCECDQPHEEGRIIVRLPKECVDGTVVHIFSQETGDEVWHGPANDEGVFDTDCTLKCPAMYKVVPRNPNCVFYPESIEVEVPCCPEIANVTFECKCDHPNEGGRIIVRMPRECLDGTIVYIYNPDGTVAWRGTANDQGIFDTDCTLKCPEFYKVVPMNKRCKFFPEAREVKVPCCPEKVVVDFKCECDNPDEGGRILAYVPANCVKDTIVYVYASDGTMVWKGTSSTDQGLFDTGCTLKCPATYKVVPKNPRCTFYPEAMEVKVPCCPEVARVQFKCECEEEKAGRIVVSMSSNCLKDTTVTIYNDDGDSVWSGQANRQGVFDTGCTLKCPAAYKVVPRNKRCTFFPESQTVKIECCPKVTTINFRCKCEETLSKKSLWVCLSIFTQYLFSMLL